MNQPTDFNQMSSDELLRELLSARALLFRSDGRHGIDKKVELRNIIGGTSQVLQRRRQQGEEIKCA